MIEKYYEALQKRENLRENLVGLRAQIKDEAAKEQFVSMIGDGGLLLELLEEEDPKVRKNVAMILGELEWMGAADALVTAYEREQTLFVKSTYLKALAYLDIVKAVRGETKHPLAVYNVSGEYSMVKAAALNGWIDEKRIVMENMIAMKRAGADILITYHALDVARWLQDEQ